MNLKNEFSKVFGRARDAIGRARLSGVELAFMGAAILFATAVALFYSYKVLPLGYMVASRQRQIKDLKTQIEKLNVEEKKRLDQASNAEKILESLSGFESRLTPDERGMTQIINEIDALGATHKIIVNDSTYRVEKADEQQLDENGNPKPRPNRDKRPKIYPNLGVVTSVVGDYPNLRRFLSDLERSKQFLIVNSLSFQGDDQRIARQLAKGGKQLQLSSSEAIPVTLKIELDTYFKPPAAGAATAQSETAAPKNAR
jgi:type II secretion system (T2SS) protein M